MSEFDMRDLLKFFTAISIAFFASKCNMSAAMNNLTEDVQRLAISGDRLKQAEMAYKKLLNAFENGQQLFEEDMLEQHAYADVHVDWDTLDRWESEIGARRRGRELDNWRLEFRFAILPTHYQLACLFTTEFGRQLYRENDQKCWRSVWAFQGDEGQSNIQD